MSHLSSAEAGPVSLAADHDDESATTRPTTPAVVIALVSYRRPDELAATLPLLLDQMASVSARTRILVVDNDPDGSARPVVDALGDDRIAYAVEPQPGIAAARNHALDRATDDDLLIFIDDDETPSEHWLRDLLATYEATRPAAVVGPVISEFVGTLDPWIVAGGFFERRRMPTGTRIETAATNNLLLDLARIRDAGLRFDPAFGLSGGSDTLFTRQLTGGGLPMVWCDEAIVVDHVPAARTTREWVTKRAMRYGNSWSRTSIVLAEPGPRRVLVRAEMVARGTARLAGGAARMAVGMATRSLPHQARGRRTLMKGVGYVRGAIGSTYTEYARPAARVGQS